MLQTHEIFPNPRHALMDKGVKFEYIAEDDARYQEILQFYESKRGYCNKIIVYNPLTNEEKSTYKEVDHLISPYLLTGSCVFIGYGWDHIDIAIYPPFLTQ